MSAKPVRPVKPVKPSRGLVMGEQWVYSERCLEYARFIHCYSVMESLLLYKEGRALFPLTLSGATGEWVGGTPNETFNPV